MDIKRYNGRSVAYFPSFWEFRLGLCIQRWISHVKVPPQRTEVGHRQGVGVMRETDAHVTD